LIEDVAGLRTSEQSKDVVKALKRVEKAEKEMIGKLEKAKK
jgi:hypothetical protein